MQDPDKFNAQLGQDSTVFSPTGPGARAPAGICRLHDAPRRLFDSEAAGIISVDFAGNVTKANDFFLDMIGYTRRDLPLRRPMMIPPEWRELDEAGIREAISIGLRSFIIVLASLLLHL